MLVHVRVPLVNSYLCASENMLARWGPGLAPWLGCRTQSRGGSLAGHYVAPAQWSNHKSGSLVPRLHLPNIWEVESGNEASQDDIHFV